MIQQKEKPKVFHILENIAPFIPVPLYWLDTKGTFLGGNDLCLHVTGAKSMDKFVGKTYDEIHSKEIAPELIKNINLVITTGRTIETEEITKDFTNGTFRHFLSIRTPLYENNKIVGIVATSTDITKSKENERLRFEEQSQRLEQQEKFKKVSAQVAHDIGSPLAALQMIVPHCDTLPENTRNVLSKSATRIADIAEHFLGQFKPKGEESTIKSVRTPTLISAEILEILTEKKYEYSKLPIELDSNISQSGAFAFININQLSFKRMMSNLINNAVDALNGKLGRVIVHLHEIDNQVQITVEDNGNGMPAEIKDKILNNIQVTSGKIDGHGIGFTQIRDTLACSEGKLDIKSQPNAGTKIILTFPKIALPDWMAESIELHNDDLVVILDDDDSIHGAWEARFEKSAPNIARQHFKQGNRAVEFINNLSQEEKQNVFLLTDYELLRQDLTGLEVIERTGIKSSILVTSHHNNTEVREQAKQTNTKILPKQLASEIPINISQNLPPQLNIASQFKKVDLVILDDDKNLVNAILMFIADDVLVDKYHIPQDFLDNMYQYDKRTKFLIDNQYSNEGITGIQIAKQMHDLGYINLNLFTGEFFEEDSGIPDYLNVVSKHDEKAIQCLLDKQ